MQKQLEANQKYINEQQICQFNMMATHIMSCEQYTSRFQRENASNKTDNPFTNVCWVSVLTTFSAPPQILAASG